MYADWVVDARGFARARAGDDGLCSRGIRDGFLKTSGHGYGVKADVSHNVSTAKKAQIHIVGAARFGDLIETIGVPEVRAQVWKSLEAVLTTARQRG